MKQKLFAFLLLGTAIFTSCRKDKSFPNIKAYDDQEIQKYIAANNLTGMTRDLSDGDTTGIYYQLLEQGQTDSPRIAYSDRLSMVYSIRSFDGKYISADTILNHYRGYLGQFSTLGLPKGLQLAIYNILKHKGASMRVLIPSRLAYGKSGFGSGSSSNTSGRIAGNQCLDYFVRIVADQPKYDDLAIKTYMAANSFNVTEYTKHPTGVYYKISGPDTSSYVVKPNSTVAFNYTLRYLNNSISQTSTLSEPLEGLIPAFKNVIPLVRPGQSVVLFVPSQQAYGADASSNGVPAFSCLRFDIELTSGKDN